MRYLSVFLGILLSFAFVSPVSAISEEKSASVSQNCASIKQSLKTLQRTDARTRAYLGSAYETVLSNYIAPLNLRLINTNQPSASLTDLHSTIITVRQDFNREYTEYSQSLEELIAIDCYTAPEDFYNKLAETRKKRATLSATTTSLRNLFSEHLTAVRKLSSASKKSEEKEKADTPSAPAENQEEHPDGN